MSDAPDPTHPVQTPPDLPHSSAASARDETAAASRTAPGGPAFGPPKAPGEVGSLGPYRVVKQLGAGGMGAVYLAIDTRLDRKLALKVMLPEFAADANARDRFVREARAAAKINHDNVVTIFTADECDGVPYIAMQFLQGYPLDDYLRTKGAPALAHVIRIAREAAAGLAAAHALGLVHRDIKPANLWLEAPNGRVKVLDFGLAKPIGTDMELTKSGAVVGTPSFMSPEQARGQKIDHRTDIFSLGAVLYRLVTGQNPFTGPNVMAVLMALGTEEPTPVRELNPSVPESLAQLIHQLLAKKPEQRPQTATEVARRLRAVLDEVLRPGAPAVVPLSPIPTASSADLSASHPVVVNPVPDRPPVVVPMSVTAQPESVFANLGAEDDAGATADEPVSDAPKAGRKRGGKGLLLAIGGAVLLAAVAVAAFSQMGKKGGEQVQAPDGGPLGDKGAAPKGPDAAKALPAAYTNALGMEFVKVPRGTSWLGGGGGKPGDQKVTVEQDFYLGKYEVTQGEWEKVMGANPSVFSRTGSGKDLVKDVSDADLKRFPVENVSWLACQEFVVRLNERLKESGWVYRLPTEAEWEYACRGGPMTDKAGSAWDYHLETPTNEFRPDQMNARQEGRPQRTCKVGSFKPNALGLYDIHGNVWEWCLDELPPDPNHPVGGPGPRFVTRGTGWASGTGFTASNRFAPERSRYCHDLGLRLVRVPAGAARPLVEWKSPPAGQSPFDKLDPNEIPKEERFDWQPKELVAVVGSHARRHWGPVLATAMSADGKLAATWACSRDSLIIWDPATGAMKWRLQLPEWINPWGYIYFTPDGRRLFCSVGKESLVVYDLAGPEPVETRYNIGDKPEWKALSGWGDVPLCEDGRTLVGWGYAPDKFGLFDVSDGKPRLVEVKAKLAGSWVHVAAGANQVVYAAPDGKLRRAALKNAKVESDEELPIQLAEKEYPRGLSSDGKRMVLWGGDHAQLWDIGQSPPKQAQKVPEPGRPATAWSGCIFSPDGRWLAVQSARTALYRIDGAEPVFVGWLDQTAPDNRWLVTFSKDGNRVVVGSSAGFVRFWDLSGEKPKEIAPLDPATAFRPPQSYLGGPALDSRTARLFLPRYDAPAGWRYQVWHLAGAAPRPEQGEGALLDLRSSHGRVVPLPNGGCLHLGLGSEPLRQFALQDGRWAPSTELPGSSHGTVASRDNTVLITTRLSGPNVTGPPESLEVWDLAPDSPRRRSTVPVKQATGLSDGSFWLWQVSFSGDGPFFGTLTGEAAGGERSLLVWNLTGPRPQVRGRLAVRTAPDSYRAAFSPEGRYLAHTADGPGAIKVVDLTGKEPRETARIEPGQGVRALAFHPDGKKLAWGGDRGAGVFDAATGTELWKWDAPGAVDWLEWAHDGRHLVVHNANKTIYVLRLPDLTGAADRAAAEWVLSVGGKVQMKGGKPDQWIAAAKDLPPGGGALTHVDLMKCQFADTDLAWLGGLKAIEHLELYMTGITDDGLKHVVGLGTLRYLSVKYCNNLTVKSLAHLAGLKKLTVLFLGLNQRATDADIEPLLGMPELEALELHGGRVSAAGLGRMRAAFPRLRQLELDGALDEAAAKEIAGMKELEILWLGSGGTLLTGAAAEELAKLPKLWFFECAFRLDEAGFRALGRMPKLRFLVLWSARDSLAPAMLGRLDPLSLEVLKLPECAAVDDTFVPTLSRLKTLKELHLSTTKVTAEGAKAIAAALPNCRITYPGGTIESKK